METNSSVGKADAEFDKPSEEEIDMEISEDSDKEDKVLFKRDDGALETDHVVATQLSVETETRRKRKQLSCLDKSPSVHVKFQSLSRESKNRLQEALRQWAEWHGQRYGTNVSREVLESGDEVYFPALQVGPTTSSSSVSFWVDRPAKQACTQEAKGDTRLSSQEREREVAVPLYDRAVPSSLSQDQRADGYIEIAHAEAPRCFNCGSYSHGLKDCPRPRDNGAINSARRSHAVKKGSAPRNASRYYQSTPGGKFDDIKPGVLGSETRQTLGIGEHDPPPWLHRMRELGYPPGYLDTEDEPSGIEIIGCDGIEELEFKDTGAEEGEIIDDMEALIEGPPIVKKMTVEFPGVNAPIPEDSDRRLWRSPPRGGHGINSHYRRSTSVSVIRGSANWNAIPGVNYVPMSRSYDSMRVRKSNYEESGEYPWEDAPPGTVTSPSEAIRSSSEGTFNMGANLSDDLVSPGGLVSREARLSQAKVNGKLASALDIPLRQNPSDSLSSARGNGHGDSLSAQIPLSPIQDAQFPLSLPDELLHAPQLYGSVQFPVCYQDPYPPQQTASQPLANDSWAQAQAALTSLQSSREPGEPSGFGQEM